jgi:hypothetical protein
MGWLWAPSNREVAFTMGRDTANKVATARDDQHCRMVQQKQLDSIIRNSPKVRVLDSLI